MPELPEVQTIVTGLNRTIIGKMITGLIENRPGTIDNKNGITEFGRVHSVNRRGKYIIMSTAGECQYIIHLRMTGKLIFEKDPGITSSHSRAEFLFQDGSKLIFDDVRTFGTIQVVSNQTPVPQLDALGVEPLSEEFDPVYLYNQMHNRTAPVKNLLLNQSIIAGLGNIYVMEILHACGIDPRKSGNALSGKDLEKIIKQTKRILAEAIKKNGTTVSDYRSVEDKSGEFQNFLKVYQKRSCQCGNQISRVKMAGRSTYYCSECQTI